MDSFSSEVTSSSSKVVSFSESYDEVIYDLEDSGKEEESDMKILSTTLVAKAKCFHQTMMI